MPKALKSRERVPAMANPHKSERTRACGGKTKIIPVPKGVNKKKLRHGNGNFLSKATMGKLKETKNFCLSPRERVKISHADLADCANFLGGAASCRSIFVIFSRKLKALTARQN